LELSLIDFDEFWIYCRTLKNIRFIWKQNLINVFAGIYPLLNHINLNSF